MRGEFPDNLRIMIRFGEWFATADIGRLDGAEEQ
jgi:hypothetical protein